MWWQALFLFLFLFACWYTPRWVDRTNDRRREAEQRRATLIQQARDRANARREPGPVEWVE